MKRFFVVGNPIGHSLSPRIHAAFARQTGIELSYETRLFGSFAADLERLVREQRPAGINVTVPFKVEAFRASTRLSERARRAGAVNTLSFGGAGISGDNTDGIGFVRDMARRCRFGFGGARLLILGAGGAARGLLAVLAGQGCARIAVANRTPSRADELAAAFGVDALDLRAAAETGEPWDMVVNATSAGIAGKAPDVPEGVFRQTRLAADLFYSSRPTPFMETALRCGAARAEDGLGMLIEQAAESFFIWNGVLPETGDLHAEIRGELSAA